MRSGADPTRDAVGAKDVAKEGGPVAAVFRYAFGPVVVSVQDSRLGRDLAWTSSSPEYEETAQCVTWSTPVSCR